MARNPIPPGSRRADASQLVQETSASATVYIVIAFVIAVVFGGSAWEVLNDPQGGVLSAVPLGLLCLIPVGYLARVAILRRRFGRLTLRLNGVPAIGRELSAELTFERCPRDVKDLMVSLKLEATVWRMVRSSKGGSRLDRSGKNIFTRELKCMLVHTGEGARAGVRLAIPADLPASDPAEVWTEADNLAVFEAVYHFWSLQVRTEGQGADMKEDFFLPVQPSPSA